MRRENVHYLLVFTPDEQRGIVNDAWSIVHEVAATLGERGVEIVHVREVGRDGTTDLMVTLRWRHLTRDYAASVKERPTAAWAPVVSALRSDALLLARYVPPSVAAICRNLGVHYADVAGNAFLDWGDLLLDVEGRRPDRAAPLRDGRPLRAFQPSGLRVLFALLCEPALARASYRDLSEASDVSVGSVHVVIKELVEHGYVEEHARGRVLHRTRDLLDRWVEGYALNLAPRLVLGRFDTDDPASWLRGAVDIREFGGQWGGESAVSLRGGHLRAGSAVVYVSAIPPAIVRQLRLRRATGDGVVVFRERFWRFGEDWTTAPSPLVYADLVASGDPRQVEAARDLREHDDDLRRLDAR